MTVGLWITPVALASVFVILWAALEDVTEKMHLSKAPADAALDPDPTGGHDPAALKDAAKKVGTDS